ncbi:MAG: acetylornithine/succinylornithine family transaminase [Rickettsiales bacterium]|jgi:acetylornithine/N-succinyldiaminopimelate aminotransferase|nr:acetylornithine/succinylornithine family transaminase [Rickettsiales bacterium]
MSKTIDLVEKYVIKTYNRFQVVIEKGEGVYVYDENDKKYLDFVGGIAVNAFGYGNQKFKEVLLSQINKNILHCSNYYYNKPLSEVAELLSKRSCFSHSFFCNSGTEANELALKLIKKYGNNNKKNKIIAFNKSFHGRTIGSLAITGQAKYRKDFEPLIPDIIFADFNDIESVKKLVDDKVAGIILEPIQGEGGIYPSQKEFLKEIRNICNVNGIILVFDEVQCGIGRTGNLFAYQTFGVEPDIISLGKGIGNGFPVGVLAVKEKFSNILVAGDHGSTFGGNPFAMTCIKFVLENLNDDVLNNVKQVSKYFVEKLKKLPVKEVRGEGLMLGIEIEKSALEVELKCIEKGLLVAGAGANVIRFVPPLVIEKEHVDECIEILSSVL